MVIARRLPTRSIAAIIIAIASIGASASLTAPAGIGAIEGSLADIAANKLAGRARISSLQPNGLEHMWALGMPTGLDRELIVEDGRIHSGAFNNHRYTLQHQGDVEAAFLVHATVANWSEIAIPRSVTSFAELETFVAEQGLQAGFDGSRPFAFRLRGLARQLKWFVVGGMGNGQPSPRQSFERSRTLGGMENVDFEALGFYSHAHRGIATNMRSNMHIHFRTTSGTPFVAHLDDELTIEFGARLLLPSE